MKGGKNVLSIFKTDEMREFIGDPKNSTGNIYI